MSLATTSQDQHNDLASHQGPNPCGCGMHKTGSDTATLLNDLLDTANVLVVELDRAGKVIWFNQAVARLSGWALEELLGQDWLEAVVPEAERAEVRQARASSGERQLPSHHKASLLARDGTRRAIDWFHKPTHNAAGEWVGVLCLGHDISDSEQIRDALFASEERAQGVLATAVNAIITISERGIIETVNAATERIFGYQREEMIGQNVSMLMPSPYRERHDGFLDSYQQTGERKIIGIGREVSALRKNGTVFPIDLSVGEVKLPNGRIFTGIIRDLSERKRLEEKILSISEEEQSRIGQDIHDDLCQQLAAIGCLAKVVSQRLTSTHSPEAQQLNEIVRLITGANVRAREMSRGLMPVVLDSAGLMAALAELARSTESIYRVSCPFRCEPPVQVSDNKIATQLYRIAQEAVANAIKHSQARRIGITLEINNGMIVLTIRDNGRGISENVVETSQGMGLLTMNHRARMLGGTLMVERSRFGGTLVECVAPALPQDTLT